MRGAAKGETVDTDREMLPWALLSSSEKTRLYLLALRQPCAKLRGGHANEKIRFAKVRQRKSLASSRLSRRNRLFTPKIGLLSF
jgi:hypothetical protein